MISLLTSCVLVFSAGVLLSLWRGHVGYMPLDQSIVFDGAWRVSTGQVPFRDFSLPNGLPLIYLQAVFFRLMGVTWFAYCLHAAILNGLFGLLALALLRRFGAAWGSSVLYAAASTVVFYPPFGVPYMEQHAFFFSLLALVLMVEASLRTPGWPRPVRVLFWFLVPSCMVLAYLSKQIPSVFVLPLMLWLLVRIPAADRPAALGSTALGLAAVAAVVGRLVCVASIDLSWLYEAMVALPSREGYERVRALVGPEGPAIVVRMLRRTRLVTPPLACLAALVVSARVVRRRPAGPPVVRSDVDRLVVGASLLLTCFAFVVLTSNHPANGMPYGFIGSALLFATIARWADDLVDPRLMRGLKLLVLVVVVVDAIQFDHFVNRPRRVHDMLVSESVPASPGLPPALGFMRWAIPPHYPMTADDFGQLARFFALNPGNFLLVGDASILYAVTHRPSVTPVLWLHPGLTLPWPSAPQYGRFVERVAAGLRRYRVKYVVVEGDRTFLGVSARDLGIAGRLAGCREQRFGGYRVVELCRGP